MSEHTPYKPQYFFRFFKPYSLSILVGLVFLIGARLASILDPIYLRNIIDAITNHKPLAIVTSILIMYFGVRLVTLIAELLRDYFYAPVIMGVSRDIERDVFHHLLDLPVSYHADQKAGSAARQVARGSRAITFILDFSISQLLPPLFELFFVTIYLLRFYRWEYGAITLATVILYTWFTLWSTEKRQKYRQEANVQDDISGGILVDSIGNMDTVKYFNNESIQFNIFMKAKQMWFTLSTKSNRLFALIYSFQGLILLLGMGSILLLAVRQAVQGQITVGDLVLVSTYIVRLTIPITTLGFVYGQFKNSIADLEAMGTILSSTVTVKDPEHPVVIENPQGKVVFSDVSFHYSGREKTIDHLNVTVEPGQKVAFVGSSGAGKSTISKLLFRLYDVNEGAILIDGVNVKELAPGTKRAIMSIVPQEPNLFNDTIANNIKFGKSNATKAEIEEAAKSAHIHDFIMSLPQGYSTLVGERGVKISGGEKQRVAIARAVVKNPKILLFDEATSSLDSKSEQIILSTLDEVSHGRTTIAIAHRLSTIVNSDVIYVLQKGKIVEFGDHATLLKKNGVYASLWKLQSQGHEKTETRDIALQPLVAH